MGAGRELTNQDRAERARTALKNYNDYNNDDILTGITDLLVDLMHLAHVYGMPLDHLVARCIEHYEAEREDSE